MKFTPQNIKGLAIKQPYADLVVLHNKVETRTWDTKYRGWVLFTSSQKGYPFWKALEISSPYIDKIITNLNWSSKKEFNLGKAIGIGKLIDSRLMTPEDAEKCYVRFQNGLFCHFYEQVQAIEPFDIKSRLNLFTLDQEIIDKIKV